MAVGGQGAGNEYPDPELVDLRARVDSCRNITALPEIRQVF